MANTNPDRDPVPLLPRRRARPRVLREGVRRQRAGALHRQGRRDRPRRDRDRGRPRHDLRRVAGGRRVQPGEVRRQRRARSVSWSRTSTRWSRARRRPARPIERRPIDEPYGDRSCWLRDPFGHRWALATPIEEVSQGGAAPPDGRQLPDRLTSRCRKGDPHDVAASPVSSSTRCRSVTTCRARSTSPRSSASPICSPRDRATPRRWPPRPARTRRRCGACCACWRASASSRSRTTVASRSTPLGELLRSDVPGSMQRLGDAVRRRRASRTAGRSSSTACAPGTRRSGAAIPTPTRSASIAAGSRGGRASSTRRWRPSRRRPRPPSRPPTTSRGFAKLADVGGGNGALLIGILQANPALRGVVFDQPHVVPRARAEIAAAGLAERCEVAGGSFFDGDPARRRRLPAEARDPRLGRRARDRDPVALPRGDGARRQAADRRGRLPRARRRLAREPRARPRTTSTCWSPPAAGSAPSASSASSTPPRGFA